jgi:hypothetical protein
MSAIPKQKSRFDWSMVVSPIQRRADEPPLCFRCDLPFSFFSEARPGPRWFALPAELELLPDFCELERGLVCADCLLLFSVVAMSHPSATRVP